MEIIKELLESVSTMTLVTADAQGSPHAAPVYFVSDDNLRLYFFSEKTSAHSLHIAENAQVAAAIYPKTQEWRDIKGLQIHGDARLVETPAERESAWVRYQKKFTFVDSLGPAVEQNQLYVLTPSWIRLVDNSQGFGFKKEWNLS